MKIFKINWKIPYSTYFKMNISIRKKIVIAVDLILQRIYEQFLWCWIMNNLSGVELWTIFVVLNYKQYLWCWIMNDFCGVELWTLFVVLNYEQFCGIELWTIFVVYDCEQFLWCGIMKNFCGE